MATEKVTEAEVAPLGRSTYAGLKEQVEYAGRPEQVKSAAPTKPATGTTVRVRVPLPPTMELALALNTTLALLISSGEAVAVEDPP
jgi:hypothetical protein